MADFEGITLSGVFYSVASLKKDWLELAENSSESWQQTVFSFCGCWLNDELFFRVETSGSTGQPKKIKLSREQMRRSAGLTGEALGLEAGDQALMCLSPDYIAGKMMLVRAMVLGLEITVVAPTANPFSANRLTGAGFDFTAFVPLQLQTIFDHGDQGHLDGMKAVLLGGADVSGQLAEAVQRLNSPVYQTFGMSETATHIALRRLNGVNRSSHYRVLPGITLGVDDRGCLTAQGVVTQNRLLTTNDIVELYPDNSFSWLGRIDNVINSGGIKVYPEKVEAAISGISARHNLKLGNCVVLGLADDRLGQKVAVVFEGNPLNEQQQTELAGLLAAQLNRYEQPKVILSLPAFCRGNNEKIDRRQTHRLLAID